MSQDGAIAVSTKRSLTHGHGSTLLSGRAAQALFATLSENESQGPWPQTVTVLMALLQGLMENTTNGDVVLLSYYKAKDLCGSLGIDGEVFEETVRRYLQFSDSIRKRNPLAF